MNLKTVMLTAAFAAAQTCFVSAYAQQRPNNETGQTGTAEKRDRVSKEERAAARKERVGQGKELTAENQKRPMPSEGATGSNPGQRVSPDERAAARQERREAARATTAENQRRPANNETGTKR